MFSGIGILGRLTKKHKHFWISCHLLPLNECFQKMIYTWLPCWAVARIIKKHKILIFLIFLKFFYRFESNHHASSVFNFAIFEEFSSLNKIIWGNPWSGPGPRSNHFLRGRFGSSMYPSYPFDKNRSFFERTNGQTESLDLATPDVHSASRN